MLQRGPEHLQKGEKSQISVISSRAPVLGSDGAAAALVPWDTTRAPRSCQQSGQMKESSQAGRSSQGVSEMAREGRTDPELHVHSVSGGAARAPAGTQAPLETASRDCHKARSLPLSVAS